MRVGLVCPYSLDRPGGVQNHVLGLAGHLLQQGHLPAVLAPGAPPPGLLDRYGLDAEHLTSVGSAVPVPYNGSVARVTFGPLSAARVARWLRTTAPDLLHIHEPITPSIGLQALALARTVPVVATFHTATPRSRTMQLAGSVLRRLIDRISARIAVSDTARTVVVQHLGWDALVVPNGFTFADYALAAEPDRPSDGGWRGGDHPVLGFVGRLGEPRKGLDVLLAAWPALRRRHPDLELVVMGAGARRLPPGVRRLGAVTEDHKIDQLQRIDVFVAPHRERESFGIVLLEALASGAAVVASDLPAFTDLLSDGSGSPLGRTFRAGDATDLGAQVTASLLTPDPGRRARAVAATERYDWKSVGREVLEVYAAVLGGGATGDVQTRPGGRSSTGIGGPAVLGWSGDGVRGGRAGRPQRRSADAPARHQDG